MSRILGIDPGLQNTGWGIVDFNNNKLSYVDCGVISTNAKEEMSYRLKCLHQGISKVISTYSPNECAIEETFVNKNPLSSLKLGHARGVLMVSAANAGMSVYEYASRLVKKSVTGSGRADKLQIASMVKYLLPFSDAKKHDSADALAIAICHINHSSILSRWDN
jgi:crossover junction endodeoxyribonuclease RuvC